MLLPSGEHYKRGWLMKQVVASMVVILVAAGILAGMVLYSVSVMHKVQADILTGEITPVLEDS